MASPLGVRLRTGLIFLMASVVVGIVSVFAGPPDNGPGGIPPSGKFGIYFTNMVNGTGATGVCPNGQVIIGFNTGATADYGKPICRTVSAYWTYSGTILFYTGGNVGIGRNNPQFLLDIAGTLRATGATSLQGTLGVSGATLIGNTLTVTGGTVIYGNLGVTGATTLGNTLIVTNGTSLRNIVGISGATLIGNTLTVTGATSLQGTLGVSGATVLGGAIRIVTGGASGYVLVSDTNGNATWQAPAVSLPTAFTGQTLRYTGTGWIANSYIYNNGSNVGIGTYESSILTSGVRNTAVGGYLAGNTMAGSDNTALGGHSAGYIMSGTYNTAIGGRNAGYLMFGSYNNAMGGYQAGQNLSGSYNTAVGGYQPGFFMTGIYNTAVGGVGAGVSMAGTYNSAFGGQSAGYAMYGAYNSAFGGYYAGQYMTGLYNTAIGGYAPTINNPSVQYSVVIGSGAYSNQSGAIIIGGSGGRVGIANPNPQYSLDVTGTGEFDGLRLPTGAATGYVLTTDAFGNARWSITQGATWQTIPLGNTSPFDPLCSYQVRFTENGTGVYLQNLYASGQLWVNADRVTANFLSLLFLNGAPQLAYGIPAASKSQYGYRSSDTGFFVSMPEYPVQEIRMLCGMGATGTGLLEADPKVGSLTLNYLSKWNGSILANSLLYDNGTSIGIGTASPSTTLTVAGTGTFYGLRLSTGAANNYILASDASGNARWVTTGSLISASGWGLTGNAGTNPSSNFVGTTDLQPVIFKMNGTEYLRISSGGSIGGVGFSPSMSGSNQMAFGQNAGSSMSGLYNTALGGYQAGYGMFGSNNSVFGGELAGFNMKGLYNTALGGYHAGDYMSGTHNLAIGGSVTAWGMSGTYNSAFGGNQVGAALLGSYNTALGGLSVGNLMSGSVNVAIGGNVAGFRMQGALNSAFGGDTSGYFMSGSINTAIGGQSAGYAMYGSYNTAVGGQNAGRTMSGLYNLALGGYNPTITNTAVQYSVVIGSGAYSNQSGAIVIGGSGANVGIGHPNPQAKLHVNGDTILGPTGTTIASMGVCTTASITITNTAATYTCTGLPATTNLALSCSSTSGAFSTPNATALYCRANGGANSMDCSTTIANTNALTYKCMWMQ